MSKRKVNMTLSIGVDGMVVGLRCMDAHEDLAKRRPSLEEMELALKAAAREIRAAFAKDTANP